MSCISTLGGARLVFAYSSVFILLLQILRPARYDFLHHECGQQSRLQISCTHDSTHDLQICKLTQRCNLRVTVTAALPHGDIMDAIVFSSCQFRVPRCL